MDDGKTAGAGGSDVGVRFFYCRRNAQGIGILIDTRPVLTDDSAPEPLEGSPHRGGILAGKQPVRAGDRYPLKSHILRQGAHAGAENSGKMDAPAPVFADDDGRGIDVDKGANIDHFKEANHILIPQGQTPVRQRGAYQRLPTCAVDIDETPVGIDPGPPVYPLLKTFQPQNTGQYQIIFAGHAIPIDTGILAIFKDAPKRRTVPYLLPDAVDTGGSFEGVLADASAETGGRGIESRNDGLSFADEERLCLDRLKEEHFSRVCHEFH